MQKNMKIGDKVYAVASDDNYLDAMGDNFEPRMVELFRALIGPQDVVADIGANIGLTALLFSDIACHVIAFEPSPSTFKILQKNLDGAGIKNVEAINLGLGHQAETLPITFAQNNRSGGYISDKIRPEHGHVTEEIRIDTIDHFFSSREANPSFLKVDVEGFEQNVIRGGAAFMQAHKPTVVMEMNHFCLDVLQRITIPDFLDFMRGAFPYLYAVDTDNATIVDLHVPDQAYFVMHEHVVRQRFPNLVGGFDPEIKARLDKLAATSARVQTVAQRVQSAIGNAAKKLAQGKSFPTQKVGKPLGAMHVTTMPKSMPAGDLVEISVNVENESNEDWHGHGSHPVLLSYHWQNTDGSDHVFDGMRTPLACESLPAGKQVRELIQVVAPTEKGRYQLILTLVQEGVFWFEDRGFCCAKGTVEVV